ncbi:type II toxin-antitoxin system PemK/MazF family toxin [Vibrio lentus]|jgi:mRNA interferase MazF|uniref:MazF family transcriptional regulator n=1 Tax=Vibrio lentus TaxID=136468 RepID=A0A2N7BPW4_9VIBR|nr:type II toxin-antitoxin system PemK/MazF family toxin [Vibrio lentus]PME49534.1 MazF family transcriptional regulator [Vibrio lentus]PME60874.1 MazF family transcriptional regulator [Vibrio lentus]PME78200.1 MazF family transcriptional regulator [Vibrio lentus]PMG64942.1 MazF family transcriptional regulator [Vibrio lentus]PMH90338.1 MazF family transcriptional regulator [Vibrio lentus]
MAQYIPKRNDIIWLDFEPVKGKEIGKYRPALVLSSKEYNQQTGLLICCPISTSIRGQATEVPVMNLDKPSVVASSLIQTLSWKDRNAKKITTAENSVMEDVLLRLIPLIGAESLFEE